MNAFGRGMISVCAGFPTKRGHAVRCHVARERATIYQMPLHLAFGGP